MDGLFGSTGSRTLPSIRIVEYLNVTGLEITCHFCETTTYNPLIYFRCQGKTACSYSCAQRFILKKLMEKL